MTLPNKLTLLRFVLVPFAVIFLFTVFPYHYYIAILVFAIAAFTDVLDGYFARKYKLETKAGIFFDPIADKLLMQLLLITLLALNIFPLWIVLLSITRDIIVDTYLSYSASHKIFVHAVYTAKIKSFFMTLSIIVGEFALSVQGGYELFGLTFENLRNAAYLILVLSFLIGLIGSTTFIQKSRERLSKIW